MTGWLMLALFLLGALTRVAKLKLPKKILNRLEYRVTFIVLVIVGWAVLDTAVVAYTINHSGWPIGLLVIPPLGVGFGVNLIVFLVRLVRRVEEDGGVTYHIDHP